MRQIEEFRCPCGNYGLVPREVEEVERRCRGEYPGMFALCHLCAKIMILPWGERVFRDLKASEILWLRENADKAEGLRVNHDRIVARMVG